MNLFHADSSASLLVHENLVSAIEEERFTKIKHYAGVPKNAIQYCLNSSNLEISDVDYIAVNYKSKYNFTDTKNPFTSVILRTHRINQELEDYRVALHSNIETSNPDKKIITALDPIFFALSILSFRCNSKPKLEYSLFSNSLSLFFSQKEPLL